MIGGWEGPWGLQPASGRPHQRWPAIPVLRTKMGLHILLCLDLTGQPAFLLGTVLSLHSPYFYPDSNYLILEELFEDSTIFFV